MCFQKKKNMLPLKKKLPSKFMKLKTKTKQKKSVHNMIGFPQSIILYYYLQVSIEKKAKKKTE